jgi:hypothetical protein
MRRMRLLLSLGILGLLAVAPAAMAADYEGTLNAETPTFEWAGDPIPSIDLTYNSMATGPCEPVPGHYCETALLHVDLPEGQTATLTIDIPDTGADDDYDLYVYKSDEDGAAGAFVDSSLEFAPAAEKVTIADATGYYLVHVPYTLTMGALGYPATATLTGLPEPEPTPEPTPEATPTPAPAPAAAPPPSPPPPPPAQPAAEQRPGPPTDGFLATVAVPPRTPKHAGSRGLGVRIGCNTGCQGVITARLSARSARKLKLGRRTVLAGSTSFSLVEAGRRTFLVRMTRPLRRALRKARDAAFEVVVEVTDDQGARSRRLVSRPVLVG